MPNRFSVIIRLQLGRWREIQPSISESGEMNVLINCERSGVVRDEFLKRGHNAWSCDLFPTDSKMSNGLTSGHLVMDARRALTLHKWDLMIGHPECTFLTLAGAKHLYNRGPVEINGKTQMQNRKEFGRDESRWAAMFAAAKFYNELLNSGIERICLENPIMHGHAAALVGEPTQYIQMWQFGHAETKKTGLRLVNLSPLTPTKIIPPDYEKWPPGKGNGYEPKVHYASPGKNRSKERSETRIGVAAAMATQWGIL